jgi:hypothetical protein
MGQSYKGDSPLAMADYAEDAARLMDGVGRSDLHVMGSRSEEWWRRNWRCATTQGAPTAYPAIIDFLGG